MLARSAQRVQWAAAARAAAPAASRSCHVACDQKQRNPPIADIEKAAARLKLSNIPKRQISADASAFMVNPHAFSRPSSISITLPADAEEATAAPAAQRAIDAINEASVKHPMSTFYCFFASRAAGFTILWKGFAALHLAAAPELAVGYLFSRFTFKLRQPVNIAVAAALQRIAPILSSIKVTALVGAITPPPEAEAAARDAASAARARLQGHFLGDSAIRAAEKGGELAGRAGDLLEGPVNKYGAALWVSSKASNLVSIAVVAVGVRAYGWDFGAMLGEASMAQGAAEGAGAMAAAVMVNTMLIPLHLWAAVRGAPMVGAKASIWERQYYQWVKSVEERLEGKSAESGAVRAPAVGGARAFSTRRGSSQEGQ
mmetsp:Transcript_40738/g.79769  ORF Transcript_40738/g.79769 Transcript_40738/m.79769 type:complete len:373 (-) Transcript_40738:373-1491(-)|eukprot:CAMPEP_0173380794 /NCGR_PEP_ID=MMETSP1356-20130122/3406_1 /TAXON_ID=77927 ORGANISM="Hemiselmis virescens, Strain PCC157" /NCGR_SAMPLE_ID=MMETSP1356 /ASSEMBLY_ACC=CAM_ASM_000847 /LENGTH=372 /DNA_ID=CAMNT_0014334501 /DNA_START=234 /DNA_END=1352 /DNA_ORIENTATION=+